MWKTRVIIASDRIFPGLIYHDREKQFYDAGNIIKSSLPLQMALYFNLWLFPVWFFIIFLGIDAKYYYLSSLYKFITVTLYVTISTLECIRLWFGYLGNLVEKIPELASFWLLSTLLQFPLMMFMFWDENMQLFFIERLATGLMIVLVIAEIISGTIALKNIAEHHSKRFYMSQLCGIDNKY
ncbi:transmembrane protein 17B-like [Diachasmimorpha longicaudata]|uniref:transmembrane protein 17B-like n=1 Tax=Diachasmimorpha longicaudata TaxID=58733 RepID=UPI0030B8B7CC